MKSNSRSVEPLSLKKNMLWNSVGSVVNLGFQWLMTVVVVRISGDYEAAGILALAMAVYNITGPIAVYRMFTYQISDVEHENTLGEYFTLRTITISMAMFAAIVYSAFSCPIEAMLPIVVFMIAKMCAQFIDPLHGTDQLNRRMDYIGKSYIFQGVGTFAAFCVVFSLTGSLVLAFAVMAVVVALVGVFYDYPRTTAFEPLVFGISASKAKHLLIYCLPVVLATIASTTAYALPRQYLAMSQGEALLGAYASIAAPAAVIQMGATYIYNPLLSSFASYYIKQDRSGFTRLLAKASVGILAAGIAASVLLLLFGEWLLVLLFGPSIVDYTYLLIPVLACTLLAAYLWFLSDLLLAIREFKGAFFGNVIALGVAALAMFPLVDAFGANGVSFTNIVSFIVGIVVLIGFLINALWRQRTEGKSSAN